MPLSDSAGDAAQWTHVEVKPELASIFVAIYLDLENCFYFSATALVTYDYFLTLDREIAYVWRAKQSLATLSFYGFRYPALFNITILLLIRMSWPGLQSNWSCNILELVQLAVDIVIIVSSTVFAALRVYAMFNRSRLLFCLVLLSGLMNPALLLYIITSRSLRTLDAYGKLGACMLTIIGDDWSYEKWMIGARVASLVSDSIVLVLTFVKTFKKAHWRDRRIDDVRPTLMGILLRDTVLCFSFLCIVNIIGIATGRIKEFIAIWQAWTAALTTILFSRLALDLRELSAAEDDGGSEFYSRTLRDSGSEDPSAMFTEVDLEMITPACVYNATR
ncbi:hypothetical protein FOMPIDRAFT_1023260 [Fomitopsis schrenkii]|uniref:DUF6533 domain-containing protein n=1 Tax=Fomitopsis schrenkii TaxID=2126942 RepID=S8EDN8_FOMSC|nr:hypothetical protein FOMPIDRAFT_1023260 [Fomitopsis schrenkii]